MKVERLPGVTPRADCCLRTEELPVPPHADCCLRTEEQTGLLRSVEPPQAGQLLRSAYPDMGYEKEGPPWACSLPHQESVLGAVEPEQGEAQEVTRSASLNLVAARDSVAAAVLLLVSGKV